MIQINVLYFYCKIIKKINGMVGKWVTKVTISKNTTLYINFQLINDLVKR